jgi:hypothetical protein
VLNVFDAIGFNNNPFDPGGPVRQLVLRLNWYSAVFIL